MTGSAGQPPGILAQTSVEPGQPLATTPLITLLITAVAIGALLFLIGWAAPVLAPLGLGLFVTALAAPLFGWLEGHRRSAPVALVITIGVVVVIGAAIVLLAFISARSLADSLSGYSTDLEARYTAAAGLLTSLGIRSTFGELVGPETMVAVLRSIIDILAQVGTSLAFAVVIAALLLLDSPRLARLQAGGAGATNPVFREVPSLARTAVTYFVVRIRINAVTALGLLVLMLALGVDDPLLWAVGAFFLSFVPYLGLALALIPPTILAFAESGPLAAGLMLVGGVVLNVIAENVLEPTLTGRALSLSTWLVFMMFFLWVWLIGPVGAVLSMPITVMLVLVLQRGDQTGWIARLVARD